MHVLKHINTGDFEALAAELQEVQRSGEQLQEDRDALASQVEALEVDVASLTDGLAAARCSFVAFKFPIKSTCRQTF